DRAKESCPVLPGSAAVIHRRFDDPPKLAAAAETDEQVLQHYRRVRDEIAGWCAELAHQIL
ncbi:MAG TPA: arsenate reductase ArsC, partial [Gammaproteobacteria bacterium]|nr:arsenate reductase ArsC [Gammaproteobacteria bacterium]